MSTYYVATTGSDSNSGAIGSPFLTIGHGVSVLVAGDTLYLRGGSYIESVTVGLSGSSGNPITIRGYPSETPIISGNNYVVPSSVGAALLSVTGHDVIVQDVTVTQSKYVGVQATGASVKFLRVFSHHNRQNGILLQGNNDIADTCDVWYNVMEHEFGQFVSGYGATWSTGLSAARAPDGCTIQNCTVRENWGEGLSTFEATHTTMQDCIVYDNWAANIYVSDTTDTIVQRNLAYYSSGFGVIGGYGSDHPPNIYLGDETFTPASARNTVINNLVRGGGRNLFVNVALNNVNINNNTFVDANAAANVVNVQVATTGHVSSTFRNNIIRQVDSVPMGLFASTSGITIDHNAWYAQANPAAGSGDITANPLLADAGATGAGTLTSAFFVLTSGSPCRDVGITLASVPVDFNSIARPQGSAYDIGALEFVSGGGGGGGGGGGNVAFDAKTGPQTGNGSSVSWSHTCTGTDCVLLVASTIDSGGPAISSVTYGGTALTLIDTVVDGDVSVTRAELWVLKAAPAGTATVAVTYASAGNYIVGAASFTNTHQTTPIRQSATARGLSTTPSVSVVSATTDQVMGSLGIYSSEVTVTSGGGQTVQWDTQYSGGIPHGTSVRKTGASATTIDSSLDNAKGWGVVVASVQPPAGSGVITEGVGSAVGAGAATGVGRMVKRTMASSSGAGVATGTGRMVKRTTAASSGAGVAAATGRLIKSAAGSSAGAGAAAATSAKLISGVGSATGAAVAEAVGQYRAVYFAGSDAVQSFAAGIGDVV